MSPLGWLGVAVLVYLALLARRAWMEGEFGKFLLGLVFVAVLLAVLGGLVGLYAWLVG